MNQLKLFSNEKIFSRLLNNKSSKNYWNYIVELRKRKTEDIYIQAVEFTKSKDNNLKEIGVNILSQLGNPRIHLDEIINILFELLDVETDKNLISSILTAISHNNENLTDQQVEKICTFKNHKSSDVRYSVVYSLLTIEKDEAINALIELSNDKHSDVRDWATFGIGTQIELDNELIREALWNRIKDKDEDTKQEAINGLAKRKDPRIKEILIKELENIDESGSLLLESIEEFNDKDFIELIEKQIIKNRETKNVEEEWLEITLANLKESE